MSQEGHLIPRSKQGDQDYLHGRAKDAIGEQMDEAPGRNGDELRHLAAADQKKAPEEDNAVPLVLDVSLSSKNTLDNNNLSRSINPPEGDTAATKAMGKDLDDRCSSQRIHDLALVTKEAIDDMQQLNTLSKEGYKILTREVSSSSTKARRTNDPNIPLFEIRPSLGKGLGVFATQCIEHGTEILREAPIMTADEDWLLNEAFLTVLSKKRQKELLALHSQCNCKKNPCRETELMRIVDLNSFEATTSTGEKSHRLFATAARINHDCYANAIATYDQALNVVIGAVRDIQVGEEITIMYMDSWSCKDREVRQEFLLERYGFNCNCTPCTSNPDFSKLKFPSFEVRETDSHGNAIKVLGKESKAERERKGIARAWHKVIRFKLNIDHQKLGANIQLIIEKGDSRSSNVELLMLELEKQARAILTENNQMGLSEDVIVKTAARRTRDYTEELDRCFEFEEDNRDSVQWV